MKKILITGAGGFIGRALSRRVALFNNVISIYHRNQGKSDDHNIIPEQVDLSDRDSVFAVCRKYSPDIIIHCAGIAHQKAGSVTFDDYMQANSLATQNLAEAGFESNNDLRFIFLSSVSVYGEPADNALITENSLCLPSSDYAMSKLDAEERLIRLFKKQQIKNLDILRVAPVYDYRFRMNLNRRVLAPNRLIYLRFGSGAQKISALARPNLVDFICFLVKQDTHASQLNIMNVCDFESYTFNQIIRVFKTSGVCPARPVVPVPLITVRGLTRAAGLFFPDKKKWLNSCCDKLAYDLVFDNTKMRKTGFKAKHSLKTVFNSSD